LHVASDLRKTILVETGRVVQVKAKVKAQYKKDKAVFGNMFAKGNLYKEEPAIAKKDEDMDSYLGDDAADDQVLGSKIKIN
jgi:hypothetical protein